MSLRKLLCISSCIVFCLSVLTTNSFAQERERVVQENPTRTTETQPTTRSTQRPTLTNQIVVQNPPSLVKNTVSSKSTAPASNSAAVSKNAAGLTAILKSKMVNSMQSKLGIPYLYGSTGPNRYDCSGLVWTIFKESGIDFGRGSARTYYSEFDPVEGDERYRFGTLVFFNGLGHMGIVVDDKGFYHASTSRGVMYSKFEGYWAKRIVGYRRVPIEKYIFADLKPEAK